MRDTGPTLLSRQREEAKYGGIEYKALMEHVKL